MHAFDHFIAAVRADPVTAFRTTRPERIKRFVNTAHDHAMDLVKSYARDLRIIETDKGIYAQDPSVLLFSHVVDLVIPTTNIRTYLPNMQVRCFNYFIVDGLNKYGDVRFHKTHLRRKRRRGLIYMEKSEERFEIENLYNAPYINFINNFYTDKWAVSLNLYMNIDSSVSSIEKIRECQYTLYNHDGMFIPWSFNIDEVSE